MRIYISQIKICDYISYFDPEFFFQDKEKNQVSIGLVLNLLLLNKFN